MNGAIPLGSFVLGWALLVLVLACSAGTAAVMVRRRFDYLAGAPRGVAFATLTIAAILLVHLVPLALGVLTRGTVAIGAVMLLLAAPLLRQSAARRSSEEQSNAIGPLLGVSWLLAGVAALATAIGWLAFVQTHAAVRVTSVDALAFHLPGVIGYIQTGSLWHITQFLPGQAQGNYPQYGDLLLLAAALSWHSIALVRYVDPLLLALAALSVYAIARELRAEPPTAALAACALVAIRPVLGPGLLDVLTDPTFLASFGAGILFLLRHRRTRRRGELVLAGVALGIALGTKWYGLTDVPAVIAIWLIACSFVRRPRHIAVADGLALVAVVLLVGGVWMLRNWVLTGNPVFDYKFRLLGTTIFSAPPDLLRSQLGFSLAHYFGDGSVLRRYAWPVFRSDFGLIGALIAGGTLAAAAWSVVSLGRSRAAKVDTRILMLAAVALALAAAYAITPYTAQGLSGAPVLISANTRYAAPALLVGAPLLAWLASRLGFLRLAVEGMLAVVVVINLGRYVPVSAGHLALAALAIALVGAACWMARGPQPAWRLAPIAGLLLGLGAPAYHNQRALARAPYTPNDPVVAYVLAHDPAHERIALTGEWTAQGLVPVAPLFGPRLENHVDYLGPVIEHRVEQYRRAAPFQRALRGGRYQLLVVGTGFPPRPDPPGERWARRIGYTPLIEDPRLVLLRAGRASS